jgi:hypothetical protein
VLLGARRGMSHLVRPDDDLQAQLHEAAAGDILVLANGTYTSSKFSVLTVGKSVVIRALCVAGSQSLELWVDHSLSAGCPPANPEAADGSRVGTTGIAEWPFWTGSLRVASFTCSPTCAPWPLSGCT